MLFRAPLLPCPQRDTSRAILQKEMWKMWYLVAPCEGLGAVQQQYWVKLAKTRCSSIGISDFKPFLHTLSVVLQDVLLQMRTPYSRTTFSHSFFFQIASFSPFFDQLHHCIFARPEYGLRQQQWQNPGSSESHSPFEVKVVPVSPSWELGCYRGVTLGWVRLEKGSLSSTGSLWYTAQLEVTESSDPQHHLDFCRTTVTLDLDRDVANTGTTTLWSASSPLKCCIDRVKLWLQVDVKAHGPHHIAGERERQEESRVYCDVLHRHRTALPITAWRSVLCLSLQCWSRQGN